MAAQTLRRTLEAKVLLPKEAPWLLDFERELLAFPLGKHDDMVDAFALALGQTAGRGSALYWAAVPAPRVSFGSSTHAL